VSLTPTPPLWYCAFWLALLVAHCAFLYALKRWL
jgi:hypothetical protein